MTLEMTAEGSMSLSLKSHKDVIKETFFQEFFRGIESET